MAAAAILDFSVMKFEGRLTLFTGCHFQSRCQMAPSPSWILWKVNFDGKVACETSFLVLVIKPCINTSHSDQDIAVKVIFQMASTAISNLVPSQFLACTRFWIAVLCVKIS